MTQLDFITRQLAKAEKKRYEHYVVTRIWHLLDDLSIKFVTQQYVRRPNGCALTDMFFPQLLIHIEIDEGHHKKQCQLDQLREADIINATGHLILRVDVTKDIIDINNEITKIVEIIKIAKSKDSGFIPWNYLAQSDPVTYINKGFIDLKDDCAFDTMVDAANCFGHNIKPKGIWKGGVIHPRELGKIIWFPKLYKNEDWNNSISVDETEIREINEDPIEAKAHINRILNGNIYQRIIFARVKGPLGDIMYRYKGEYELDLGATNYTDGLLWRRIGERVKTY